MAHQFQNNSQDLLPKCLALDLVQYAISKGYVITEGKTSSTYVTLKNKNTNDSIRVKQSTMPMLFRNNNNVLQDQDYGNIINFFINRSTGIITSNPRPTGLQRSIAYNVLLNFSSDPNFQITAEHIQNKKRITDTEEEKLKYQIKDLKEISTVTYDYLRKRFIADNIVHNPIFAGKIKESPVLMKNNKVINNIAFVRTDPNNKITGFQTQYFSAELNQFKKCVFTINDGIWRTNKFENTKNIFFGEAALDCISHYEMKRPPDATYISYEGQISIKKLDELYDIYEDIHKKHSQDTVLISITDNDEAGFRYDLSTAIHFHNKLKPDEPIEKIIQPNNIKYVFHGHFQNIDLPKLKDEMLQRIRLELPTTHNAITPYFNLVELKDLTIIEIPFSSKNLKNNPYHLLKPLASAIFKNANINFAYRKPITKDWNDDLKAFKIEEQKKNVKHNKTLNKL